MTGPATIPADQPAAVDRKGIAAAGGERQHGHGHAHAHGRGHLGVLDGWRALSILAVLAGHWLPLGPSAWQMNAAAGATGMALFFCLSGFLITHFLLADDRVWPFVVKRLTRIIPLAWAAMLVLIVVGGAGAEDALANFLFVSNLPPDNLLRGGHHLWSLCVEMQFYATIALIVAVAGRRGLYLIPVLCLAITLLRIADGQIISIVTWHRVDEILAGGCVALWWHWRGGRREGESAGAMRVWLPVAALAMLVIAANPHSGALGYLRPYFSALAVGASLVAFPVLLERLFTSAPARYVAEISYALYVIHGMLTDTWLGGKGASTLERYALRIPLALLTWLLAHLSTRHYEARFSAAARLYLRRRDAARQA